MCCNNRTHVIVISTVWLVLTGISAICNLVQTIFLYGNEDSGRYELNQAFGGYLDLIVGIEATIHIFWITTAVLSIVGAVKNNKYLLIPFMIAMALQIFGCIVAEIFFCVLFGRLGFTASALIYIIPPLIVLGISIYFLRIQTKLFNQLAGNCLLYTSDAADE